MMELPKLYTITDCQLSNCTNIEIVRMLLDGGARIIQLRDKEASSRLLLEQARDCLKLTREAGAMLIINDRADVSDRRGRRRASGPGRYVRRRRARDVG